MKKRLAIAMVCLILLTACTLDTVDVNAPAVNCIFDTDCTIVVSDKTDEFVLDGMAGSGFLQSRTLPVGEPGTPGEGLYGYEYRIDVRDMAGVLHIECVDSFSIDFGPISSLDYDEDGNLDDVYVVTSGGLGNVAPSSASESGDRITFSFSPGVCPGSAPGYGDSSFFFGLASTHAPRDVQAELRDTGGNTYLLEARAPDFP